MKILLIHPGHAFSTADVFDGLYTGLCANGVEVVTFPLDQTLEITETLVKAAKMQSLMEVYPDPFALAAAGIPGMAMYHQIDACIAVTGQNLPFSIPLTLRKANIRTAILCTESPYLTLTREMHDAAVYDVVFTNERLAVPLFTRNPPIAVHYLAHAYNPMVHVPGPVTPALVSDVYFCGTGFDERKALFGGMDWSGISYRWQGSLWDNSTTIEGQLRGVTPNANVAQCYRAARIALNHHRTTGDYKAGVQIKSGSAESLGPRAYEIAACGAFQLCDDSRPELGEVFGDSVPTYRSGDSADLERQIRYWLAHPDERQRLAQAAHEAVQAHSWVTRAIHVLNALDGFRPAALHSVSGIVAAAA